MTITSDSGKVAGEQKLTAADLARQRRARRDAKIAAGSTAEPIMARAKIKARRVPFVAVLVALLAAGLAGVLWLNTLTDEAGIRANEAKESAAAAQLKIESLSSVIAARNATPAIAAVAQSLGLVPAGDAAILVVPSDGTAPSVIGTPTPVVDPVAVAAAAAAAAGQAAADAAAKAAAQAAADVAAQSAAADAAAQSAAAQSAAAAQAALPSVQTTDSVGALPVDQSAAQPVTATTEAAALVTTALVTTEVVTTQGAAG